MSLRSSLFLALLFCGRCSSLFLFCLPSLSHMAKHFKTSVDEKHFVVNVNISVEVPNIFQDPSGCNTENSKIPVFNKRSESVERAIPLAQNSENVACQTLRNFPDNKKLCNARMFSDASIMDIEAIPDVFGTGLMARNQNRLAAEDNSYFVNKNESRRATENSKIPVFNKRSESVERAIPLAQNSENVACQTLRNFPDNKKLCNARMFSDASIMDIESVPDVFGTGLMARNQNRLAAKDNSYFVNKNDSRRASWGCTTEHELFNMPDPFTKKQAVSDTCLNRSPAVSYDKKVPFDSGSLNNGYGSSPIVKDKSGVPLQKYFTLTPIEFSSTGKPLKIIAKAVPCDWRSDHVFSDQLKSLPGPEIVLHCYSPSNAKAPDAKAPDAKAPCDYTTK